MQKPSEYKTPLPLESYSLFVWMWFFIRPHKWKFFGFTMIRLLGSSAFILGPLFIKQLIEFFDSPEYQLAPEKAYWFILAIGVVHAVAYFLFLFRNHEGMLRDLMKRELSLFAMKYMVSLPFLWHESQGTGNKMQRIFTARNSFSSLISLFFIQILVFIGKVGALFLVILFTTPPIFLLLFFIHISLYLFVSFLSSRKMVELNDVANEFFENILGKVYEFTSAVFTVKFMNLLPFVEKKAWTAELQQRKNIDKLLRVIFNRWFFLNNIGNICFIGIALYSVYLLIHGQITTGVTVMLIWYAWDVWGIIDDFANVQEEYFENKNGFMRLTEIFREKKEELDFEPMVKFPKSWNEIRFEKLSFFYEENEALKNLNLVIPRGQKVALVGKSGSGKSTFIKLFMKQVLASSGGIYFDEINIQNIRQSELLKNIAVVLQDTELFNVSVKENVLLDSLNAKNLQDYLRMAHADDFVSALPEKENTVIGERGVKLSGGEKQRIGIARALAQESEIIVFDEATSALDTESERAIQKAMSEIFKNKTAIIIAHRLSTIKEVDRILVFDKGKIIEDGSFEDLLAKNGQFAKLWKLQKLD